MYKFLYQNREYSVPTHKTGTLNSGEVVFECKVDGSSQLLSTNKYFDVIFFGEPLQHIYL